MECGLLVGPSAVPKRPQCGAAQHLPGVLTAPSEPSLKGCVLCVLVPFLPDTKKAFFLMPRCCCIKSVLMQLFLWNWAFPLPQQRLWFISNLVQRFPAPPFFLKPSFCLQHGFSCCGDHMPCSCLMPGRSMRGILNPEGRGTTQPRLRMVVGNQDPSCAMWPQTRPSHHSSVFPLFSLQLLGNCIPANSRPQLNFPFPLPLAGPACFCHALCEHCISSAVSGVQGYLLSLASVIALCPLSLLPALLHLGSLGMSRARGLAQGQALWGSRLLVAAGMAGQG